MRLAALSLAFAGAAQAAPLASVTYVCDGGAVLRAAYLQPAQGDGFAVIDWQGRLIPMAAIRVASGAGYADADGSLVWRTRGDEGFLVAADPEQAGGETVVLANCVASR